MRWNSVPIFPKEPIRVGDDIRDEPMWSFMMTVTLVRVVAQ